MLALLVIELKCNRMDLTFLDNAKIQITGDGSPTLFLPDLQESYHSRHGAMAESKHVFIDNGLIKYQNENPNIKPIRVLEVGFGTGLNAFNTLRASKEGSLKVDYHGLEAYPPKMSLLNDYLNILDLSDVDRDCWRQLHSKCYLGHQLLSNDFSIEVSEIKIEDYNRTSAFDLIYFDAFAPQRQPNMWTLEVLSKCYSLLKTKGHWVTYCAKGQLKRDLRSLGFEVITLPGAPGKKEMTLGVKK